MAMSVDINMNPALQATSFAEEISLSDHRHDDKRDKDKEEKDLSSASDNGPSTAEAEAAPAISSRELKRYSIAFAVTTFGVSVSTEHSSRQDGLTRTDWASVWMRCAVHDLSDAADCLLWPRYRSESTLSPYL